MLNAEDRLIVKQFAVYTDTFLCEVSAVLKEAAVIPNKTQLLSIEQKGGNES